MQYQSPFWWAGFQTSPKARRVICILMETSIPPEVRPRHGPHHHRQGDPPKHPGEPLSYKANPPTFAIVMLTSKNDDGFQHVVLGCFKVTLLVPNEVDY